MFATPKAKDFIDNKLPRDHQEELLERMKKHVGRMKMDTQMEQIMLTMMFGNNYSSDMPYAIEYRGYLLHYGELSMRVSIIVLTQPDQDDTWYITTEEEKEDLFDSFAMRIYLLIVAVS